jgi:AraC family transcriptional regulator
MRLVCTDMTVRPAEATSPEGTRYRRAVVGPFEVTRLTFLPNFRHPAIEPERGYFVVVLDGAVCKTFVGDTATLRRDSFATLPVGATHSSTFGPSGTQVLAVRSAEPEPSFLFGSLLAHRRHVRTSSATALGWRIAGELEARDASWSLAVEGLVLQLLATAQRASSDLPARSTAWLRLVRDLMHERIPDNPSLGELARLVGRHPTHVARAFRREYGLTVAEYARSLRLDWAAGQLAIDDAPLAQVAVEAGFADQSHFTRAFRRHTGVPPGRYRRLMRG